MTISSFSTSPFKACVHMSDTQPPLVLYLQKKCMLVADQKSDQWHWHPYIVQQVASLHCKLAWIQRQFVLCHRHSFLKLHCCIQLKAEAER